MTSFQSRIFNILLKIIKKKTLLKARFTHKKIDIFNRSEPTRKILSAYRVEKYKVMGYNVFTLNPGEGKRHILYLHGGAYVEGFIRPHWDFMHMLIKNLDCTITAPDYPRAPVNTHKETFQMMSVLYRKLAAGVNREDFILMGDSSGGGMALALAQLMKNEKVIQPARIILLSPWLDLELSNPEIMDIDPSDLFLGVDSLRLAGKAYAGDADPAHYLLSPVNGPLDGLGEISLFVGSREILVADARKLKSKAEEQGIRINYFEYPGMFHAWMLLNLPESKRAKKQIIGLVRKGKD